MIGLLLVFLSSVAFAFNAETLSPGLSPRSPLGAETPQTLGKGRFLMSFTADYARRVAEFSNGKGLHVPVLPGLGAAHLGAGMGLGEGVDAACFVPVALYDVAYNPQRFLVGVGSEPSHALLLGDVRALLKVRLLTAPFEASAVLWGTIPTGSTAALFGDGASRAGLEFPLQVAAPGGRLQPYLTPGISYLFGGSTLQGTNPLTGAVVDLLPARTKFLLAGGLRALVCPSCPWTAEAGVRAQFAQGVSLKNPGSPAEWAVGVSRTGDAGVTYLVSGGAGFGQGVGAPSWRIVLGVRYSLPLAGRGEAAPAPEPVEAPIEAQAETMPFTLGEDHYASEAGGEVLELLAGGQVRTLGEVTFGFGSAELDAKAKATVAKLYADLAQLELTRVTITGHTDSVGSKASNDSLSLRRAQSVKAELVRLGLRASLAEVRGMGFGEPRVPNDTRAHRAQNRRMEVSVNGEVFERPGNISGDQARKERWIRPFGRAARRDDDRPLENP